MEPKSAPGPSGEGEISLGRPPGGHPEDHNEFLFGSGGFRERFGRPPGRQNKDVMLRSLFFRLREAPGSDVGAILVRCWLNFGAAFEAILGLT